MSSVVQRALTGPMFSVEPGGLSVKTCTAQPRSRGPWVARLVWAAWATSVVAPMALSAMPHATSPPRPHTRSSSWRSHGWVEVHWTRTMPRLSTGSVDAPGYDFTGHPASRDG